jgi:hypothetical protein
MPIEFGSFSLGAIAGGIVIGIANHYLSKSRNKEQREINEFNNAAAIFRDVFLPETAFLKYHANIGGLGSSNNLHEILSSGYLRQLKAFETFKPYLSPVNRIGIDKAWQEYCRHPDNQETLYFKQYSTKNVSRDREAELKNIALERIEKILEFAKNK